MKENLIPKINEHFNKPMCLFYFILYDRLNMVIIYQILVIDYYVGMTYNIDINKCLEVLLWMICM